MGPLFDQQSGELPDHLTSVDLLDQHIRAELEDLSTTEKGDKFAHLVQRLIPQTDVGLGFGLPELREKKSGDEGVDLIAEGKDDTSLM